MRLPFLSPERPTRDVPLRGGTVRVAALPLGALQEAEVLFPAPAPPERYRRKPGTDAIEFDRVGKPVREPDVSGPEHRRAAVEAARLQAAYWLRAGIVDPAWVWETPEALRSDPRAFYAAIHQELLAAGLTDGEVLRLRAAIVEMSMLGVEHVEAALEGFSRRAAT